MTWTRAPAHLLAGSFCAGLALANLTRLHTLALVGSVLAAVAAVVADSPATRLALAAALLCLCGWWWASTRLDALDRSPMRAEVGRAGRAIAVITAPPSSGRFGIRAEAKLRRFDGAPVAEPVLLELPLGRAPPQGAVIDALARVRLPRGPSGGFDEEAWLRRRGVHVVLAVDEWRPIGRRGGLGGLADRLRARLAASIAPGLAGERRAVLEGIVLGDTQAIPTGLRNDFQASGLYHLLAVSGQNVILVAAGALLLAWLAGVGRWLGELGALVGICAYVLAVGPQPSVIRAGISGALASLAWLTGRIRDAWYVLLVGAVVLLAWNPYLVFDPGFELSFAAVAAIFTLAPRFARRLEGYPLPRAVRAGVAVSTACGLVTAPILVLQFGYLPLLSVPANALAEPAMPVLLGLAFATAGLATFSPAAAAVLAWLNGWVAAYIALCARAVAAVPIASVTGARAVETLAAVALLAAYAWRRCRTS